MMSYFFATLENTPHAGDLLVDGHLLISERGGLGLVLGWLGHG
jgi:hypothetical protein